MVVNIKLELSASYFWVHLVIDPQNGYTFLPKKKETQYWKFYVYFLLVLYLSTLYDNNLPDVQNSQIFF